MRCCCVLFRVNIIVFLSFVCFVCYRCLFVGLSFDLLVFCRYRVLLFMFAFCFSLCAVDKSLSPGLSQMLKIVAF